MTTGRQLRAVVELARLLEDRARRALPHIAREINAHDGYPAGGDGVRGNSDLTSTERAAMCRERPANDLAAITHDITAAVAAMTHAIDVCGKWLPVTADADKLRCTGGLSERGADVWGKPDCTNIQEEGRRSGLCAACRKRKQTWERGGREDAA